MSNTPLARGASNGNTGLQPAREILNGIRLAPSIGERRIRKAEAIECVRMRRQSARQNVGFSSRPFASTCSPLSSPLFNQHSGRFDRARRQSMKTAATA
jgi:hypothetical protein